MADLFYCSDCGYETTKWSGKCPNCGSWDTIKEASRAMKTKSTVMQKDHSEPLQLSSLKTLDIQRFNVGIREFDLVLGGGIVPGMVVLIGGEPGIGKSTLMLQMSQWSGKLGKKVLYCSGEESSEQINLRSKRIKLDSENVWLLCTNDTDIIIEAISTSTPDIVIVDSIQSISVNSSDSTYGSITQLKESCNRLIKYAKQSNLPMFLIGHVTKEGIVAGPRIIEHMVDTVLYFEGELKNQFKMLRSVKNRFGSTNEIGLFEMTAEGLMQVENPGNIFLSDDFNQIGTAIGCIIEGSRSFTVEVQALATSSSYGTPQRVGVGLEQKKLALLLAILEKNLSLYLRSNDVFINITGGIKTNDSALDLPILAAILSSLKDQPLPVNSIFLGEVSLNGDIRPISLLDQRINEAIKLGYKNIYISEKAKLRTKHNIHKLKDIRALYRLFSQRME